MLTQKSVQSDQTLFSTILVHNNKLTETRAWIRDYLYQSITAHQNVKIARFASEKG